MARPNGVRIEKTQQGRLRVTVVSDNERDLSAVVDPEELFLAYEEAMDKGEGPLLHGDETPDAHPDPDPDYQETP
jgi:hypothetical protein